MRLLLVLTLSMFTKIVIGQLDTAMLTDPTAKPTSPGKRSNIILHTMDGTKVKGRVRAFAYDYVVIDATHHNSAVTLNKYYMRPLGNSHKIDLEYLDRATVNKGKILAESTLYAALAFGVIGGIVGAQSFKQTDEFWAPLGTTVVVAGIGVGFGAVAGAIWGLFTRKHVNIKGDPVQLEKVADYYF